MGSNNFFQKAYRKSGMRKIYERNKEWIIPAAIALGTAGVGGAAGGVAATGAGGLGVGAGIGLGALGGAGAAIGGTLMNEQIENDKEAAKAKREEEQRRRDEASQNVDNYLRGITDPTTPITGDPTTNPIVEPTNPALPVPPSDKQIPPELIDTIVGGTPITGGAVNTGGQASKDQNDLINEAELAYKLQNEQAGKSKTDREALLKEYANLISAQQNRMLDENAPALYEDLNTRGLLRSSELGNAMARERAKSAAVLQENVGLQGLNDREAYIKALEDSNTNYIQGRAGGIQRRFSLEDFARQAQVAKDTGIALQPISTGTPSSKAGDAAMVSAGANVISAFRGK